MSKKSKVIVVIKDDTVVPGMCWWCYVTECNTRTFVLIPW